MFRDDRGRSACTGLQPVLGGARRSPRARVAGVCEDERKIIPPQVRVEGSVWCSRAPAFGRACRIMLLFPVHGASLCKAGKTGHVTARCSCTGGYNQRPLVVGCSSGLILPPLPYSDMFGMGFACSMDTLSLSPLCLTHTPSHVHTLVESS